MIQEGMLLCDHCKEQIVLSRKPCAQLLLEYVKEGIDRHYCDKCIPKKLQASAQLQERPHTSMFRKWAKAE